jgi:hypothetical protein
MPNPPLGLNPESGGECPHLSGARGVGQVLQDSFEFEFDTVVNQWATPRDGYLVVALYITPVLFPPVH